jgi:hypothetical protein
MAVLQWVIVCERVIIEEQVKAISIISILENIQLPAPPPMLASESLVPLRFYVVQQWRRSKPKIGERTPGRLRLTGPKGQYGEQEFVVDLTGTQQARVIGQAIGFPLQGPGVYQCVVETKARTKWTKVGGTHFTVTYMQQGRGRH